MASGKMNSGESGAEDSTTDGVQPGAGVDANDKMSFASAADGRRIERIPLSLIQVSGRLRAVDADWVEVLRASILAGRADGRSGLLNPVEVRPSKGGFELVAGAHRLQAIEAIGDDAIEAVVLRLSDLEARLREIDENLIRRELSALDRAAFLAERKAVWEAIYPETARGKAGAVARWIAEDGDANDKMSFASAAAETAGLSRRQIQRDIKLFLALSAASRERVRGTWLAGHAAELHALSKLGPEMQAKVLDAMLRPDGPAAKVAAAVAEIDGRRAAPAEIRPGFAALATAWKRASAGARGRFLDQLWEDGALDRFMAGPANEEDLA